jgi:hypothetical protein
MDLRASLLCSDLLVYRGVQGARRGLQETGGVGSPVERGK